MAWPVVLERFSLALLSIVDLLLVGHYVGEDAIAGVGIASLLWWLADVGVIGLAVGTTTIIGWDFGSRQMDRLTSGLQTSITVAALYGCVMAVVIAVGARPFIAIMGLDGASAEAGHHYLYTMAPSVLGLGIYHVCAGAYRGVGNTRTPMMLLLVINVVNAGVAFLLMSGVVGLELGVMGSGIGTTVGSVAGGGIILLLLSRGYSALRWRPGVGRPFGTNARRLLRLGIPAALEEMVFLFAFMLYARIVSSLGDAATAGHALAMRSVDLGVMPAFAIGSTATALVGQAMGAQRIDLAERIARTAILYAVGVMVVYATFVFFAAPYMIRLFTDDQEVIDQTTKALRVFCIAFPMMGVHSAAAGALRGAGDIFVITVFLFLTAFLLRVPLAFVGAHILDFGLAGAWMGAMIEVNARGTLTLGRFPTGKWKLRRV